MNTEILELPTVIDKVSLRKDERLVDAETTELINKLVAEKRFGIVDLWNIRKKTRSFSIYRKSI